MTADGLRAYIEEFHSCLEQTAAKYLLPERQRTLPHLALLPARITGYVSTQLGVAIEYTRAEETTIEIVRGGARVEDLFLRDSPARMRRLEPAFLIDGPNVSISGATWKGFLLFRLKAPNASIFLRDTCFRFGSWTRNVGFAEFYACRDAEEWSSGKAESRAKDEVLVAMLEVERAARRDLSISAYIDKFKDKQVLVLGDYGPEGIGRLESISHALISRGYEPILVKDIPEHPHNDILQKVVAVGSVSRFVVVDDSSKSGHIAEFERCKQNDWLTIVLRAEGHRGSWMTAGATIASKVILELEYDPSSPNAAIEAAVEWAEATLRERLVKLDETYPWRSN